MAVFGGFWDEIPYLGVKFPVFKPLLGQKTGATRGVKLALLMERVGVFWGMMVGISEGNGGYFEG